MWLADEKAVDALALREQMYPMRRNSDNDTISIGSGSLVYCQ